MRLISVLLLICGCATASGSKDDLPRGITFIEDDYPAALAQARDRNVPLFVDAWAPWCHSCVFLREHVMHDPALQHNEKRYVFLSLDTEKEKNAAFLEKYPVDTWPTLFIVDAKNEKAVLKWLGTGTVAQLEKLLDDGEVAAKGGEDLLAVADRLYADGKDATDAYKAALASLPADHPRRSRTIESLINALYKKDQPGCAAAGVEYAPQMVRGPSFVNTIALSLSCAEGAKASDAVAKLEPLAVESLKLDGILADDKSGIYELLVDLREGDAKKVLALEWLSFLEGEAAKATTPAARAVFDPHRLNAALAAGVPMKAEAALLQSEKDLPNDYNPPARLAVVYREAGRFDDALAAIERGFTRAYGPRKLRLYEIKASILGKKGDVAGQRATLVDAVTYGRSLPAPQRPEKSIARLEGEAKKLEGK